jgi:hypothetical protein
MEDRPHSASLVGVTGVQAQRRKFQDIAGIGRLAECGRSSISK